MGGGACRREAPQGRKPRGTEAPTRGPWPPQRLFWQISLPATRAANMQSSPHECGAAEKNGTDTFNTSLSSQEPALNTRQARGRRASTGEQSEATRTGVRGPVSAGPARESRPRPPGQGSGGPSARGRSAGAPGPGRGREVLCAWSQDGHTTDLVGKTLELWN